MLKFIANLLKGGRSSSKTTARNNHILSEVIDNEKIDHSKYKKDPDLEKTSPYNRVYMILRVWWLYLGYDVNYSERKETQVVRLREKTGKHFVRHMLIAQ